MDDRPGVAAPPPSPALPPEVLLQPAPRPLLTPAQGAWAALTVLGLQNVVTLLAVRVFYLPFGAALLLSFAATCLVFFTTQRETWRRLTADARWRTPPHWGVALGAFGLALVASRGLLLALLSVWPQAAQNLPQVTSAGADLWVLLLVAGMLVPLAEEIAFRGTLMRGLEWTRGALYAALLSSALFALAHGTVVQALVIFPLAWLMARAVQHSGSLWTSVTVHVLNNLLSVGLAAALQHLRGTSLGGSIAGMDMSGSHVPLSFGLAGLLLGVSALVIGAAWLTPRHAPQRGHGGPVWTLATGLLLALIMLSVCASVVLPLLQSQPFSGVR